MVIQGWFGEEEVEMEKAKYMNGNLAIRLTCHDNDGFCETYGNLTVNLGDKLPEGYAYVDTNNMPTAEEFIERYGLGEHAGKFRMSGFCCYPLYKFY